MKKLIFILFAVILLVGCTAEKVEETKEDTTETEKVVEETKEETRTEEKEEEETSSLSEDIQELIDKGNDVKSYKYNYRYYNPEILTDEEYVEYYVKGDKMKLVLHPKVRHTDKKQFYDTLYIDHSKKTVEAYCHGKKCDSEQRDQAVIMLEYNDWIRKTPIDILNSIESGEIVGSETLDQGKMAMTVEYEKNGITERVYIWEYKGIPLRYERYKSSSIKESELIERWDFTEVSYGGISDSDLVYS